MYFCICLLLCWFCLLYLLCVAPRPYPIGISDHLTYVFRPEFMIRYCADTPLSADAFSHFGSHAAQKHNQQVKDKYQYLCTQLISQLATRLHTNQQTHEQHKKHSLLKINLKLI